MIRASWFAATAAGLALATPAAAQDFAIANATVATGDGSAPIERATVVVRGGRIAAAGPGVAVPPGMQVLDGTGTWVTPGLFMPLTQLGLWDVEAVGESNDISASKSRFGAAIDVAPAINYASQHIAVTRGGGITRATIRPGTGKSIFAGQGAVIDLGADPQPIVRARAFQYVVLGEAGAEIAGGSRTAAFLEFEEALREASDFASGRWDAESAHLTRADAEALGVVVTGRQKLYIRVERAADIRAVIALKQRYPRLDLVIVGASEGWLAAEALAASGIPVIADPLDNLPATFEQLGATQSNVGRMVAAGVKVALGSFSGGTNGHPRNAAQFAGNLVALQKLPGANGLSWGQALAAITSVPAEIAGYGGQFGVLKPGAAGDLVVWDGDPLEVGSAPVQVFVEGVQQPLDNHQTRLRERYRDLDESDLPKAYDW
ncbi:MAG TPA: amidohydrolase family protein [Erythrobacter sp.]|nr:amidohydrolase family protein [Erythrobacter sp.]